MSTFTPSPGTNLTVSADPASPAPPAAAAPAAPVSERTAFAVLGTMLLLIVALTVVLVRTTWADARLSSSQRSTEAPGAPADGSPGSIAQR